VICERGSAHKLESVRLGTWVREGN
jgi:hypothetical protein